MQEQQNHHHHHHHQRVLLSTTSATTTAPSSNSNRLVISRRAWEILKAKIPPKPPTAPKPKVEDKPWPQSVQIAGYVAGGVLIPYTIIWLVTSNPTLREHLGPYLPMNKFRTHFGQLEWNALSYVDEMQSVFVAEEKGDKQQQQQQQPEINVEYYQFPDEPTYQQRKQQTIVDKLNSSEINVTINVYESDGHEYHETKIIPGKTTANQSTLLGIVKNTGVSSSSLSDSGSGSKVTVAVDFEDDVNNNDTSGSSLESNDSMFNTTTDYSGSSSSLDPTSPASILLKGTQVFSSWFYVPTQQQQQQQQQQNQQNRDIDMDISRLEYTVQELEKNLKDPTCTRDMDEMSSELRKAKRELSSLRWKRRLGFSSR